MPMHFGPRPVQQRGATLIVALIFLVLLSLFAINAFNSASTNVRVVGNMQARQEAVAAAQVAIEEVISTSAFTENTTTQAKNIDIDRTTGGDVNVSVAINCIRIRPVKNAEITLGGPFQSCIASSTSNNLIEEAAGVVRADDSLCSDTEWNLAATAQDNRSGVEAVVNQGVGVRIVTANGAPNCPT